LTNTVVSWCVLQDSKRWLRSHGVTTSTETSYYMDAVRSLFQSASLDDYTALLLQMTTKWSQPFVQYFVDNIHPVIEQLGSWQLQPYGLTSSTTNQSESFNAVLKRLQAWTEAPVDAMVLSLYRLAQYYNAEISRGMNGLGSYTRRDGVDAGVTTTTAVTPLPDDIVDNIRIT